MTKRLLSKEILLRRVLTTDVINYKNRIDAARMETLAELSAQAQELNMGY